jgi:ribonucleoside-diphosphate reductase alpha chain
VFLTACKEGSLMNAMLADVAVVISVALQHGISARVLAKSIGRLPEGRVTPADLDGGKPARIPASPIGAALDLLKAFETGTDRPRECIPE